MPTIITELIILIIYPSFERSESIWCDVRRTQKLNLQDQGIPLYLKAYSKLVWHEWFYQQLLQLWTIDWNGGVISPLYQNMLRANTSYKIISERTWLGTTSFIQQQVTKVSKQYTSCVWRMEFSLDRWFCIADYTHTAEPIFCILYFTWTTRFLSLTSFTMRDTRYQNVKPEHSECLINVTDVPPQKIHNSCPTKDGFFTCLHPDFKLIIIYSIFYYQLMHLLITITFTVYI